MASFIDKVTDSTGAFFINELERLDPIVNEPLVAYTWARDIDLRQDVSMGDEIASYLRLGYGAVGGIKAEGKNWGSQLNTAIPKVQLDAEKDMDVLHLWNIAQEYSIIELEQSIRAGRPLDDYFQRAVNLKWNTDNDEYVYIGDTTFNETGILNNPTVPISATSIDFTTATADEILAAVNEVLTEAWMNSGWAVVPNKVIVSPRIFSALVSRKVSEAGNVSILEYIRANSIARAQNNRELDIVPVKWAQGLGTGGGDRLIAYTQSYQYLRYPLVPMQRTDPTRIDLYYRIVYFCKMAPVQIVYPETMHYLDVTFS